MQRNDAYSGGHMTILDKVCIGLLHHGLRSLRDAALLGDINRCKVEAEHLHNLPSLIGEDNFKRHLYYFQFERKSFLESVQEIGSEQWNAEVRVMLFPLWDQMAGELFKLFPELKPLPTK